MTHIMEILSIIAIWTTIDLLVNWLEKWAGRTDTDSGGGAGSD
jgi:hypothetical protein